MPKSSAFRRQVAEETYQHLRRLMGVLHGRVRRRLLEAKMTLPQMLLLRFLVERGTATPKELAAKLGVTPGDITGLVDKLEASGLVTRERTRADRRVVVLKPTARAKRGAEATHRAAVESLLDAFQHWSTDEIVTLKAMLERLSKGPSQPHAGRKRP